MDRVDTRGADGAKEIRRRPTESQNPIDTKTISLRPGNYWPMGIRARCSSRRKNFAAASTTVKYTPRYKDGETSKTSTNIVTTMKLKKRQRARQMAQLRRTHTTNRQPQRAKDVSDTPNNASAATYSPMMNTNDESEESTSNSRSDVEIHVEDTDQTGELKNHTPRIPYLRRAMRLAKIASGHWHS